MPGQNLDFGKEAEGAAAEFLRARGYKVLKRNYKNRFGEIDIIAVDKGVTCFVEVKARRSHSFGSPAEAVSAHKQRQISKTALCYLKENKSLESPARFDVVSLLYEKEPPQIELIKGAFELSPGFSA